MAIYRYETRNIGRDGRVNGRSIVAAAAYRAGVKLRDERYETRHDYSRRTAGIAYSEVLAPGDAPAWMSDRERLWNGVEKAEKRKDARLAREFIIALPHELSADERQELITGFVKDELVNKAGMVVDVSIHAPRTGLNHHAHLLCATREVDASGFGLKEREWNKTEQLEAWREAWETHCNAALEKAGLDIAVDRRSLEDRGIARKPEPKLGVAGAALEKKGIESTRKRALRETHYDNQLAGAIRDIEAGGEVFQAGIGESWWERAGIALRQWQEQTAGRLVELLKDETSGGTWQAREASRRAEKDKERKQPEMDIGR